MHSPTQTVLTTTVLASEEGAGLSSARGGRAPSQKELAAVLMITTRHLRRWESSEEAAGRFCARPYTKADLWRLYQLRRGKGWDRAKAVRIGLGELFTQFDEISAKNSVSSEADSVSLLAVKMLSSLVEASNGKTNLLRIPRLADIGLAQAAKAQLLAILECDHSRNFMAKAFFEAALIAEKHVARATDSSDKLLSA